MQSSFQGFISPKPNKGGTNTGDATATAPDILIAKTAYGPLGKIVGTMPYYPSQNKLQVVVFGNTTPGRLYLQGPDGFYQGSTVYADEANFIAANLPLNLSMFGLVGTGANVKRWASGPFNLGVSGLTVTGLSFVPTMLMMYATSAGSQINGVVLLAIKNVQMMSSGSLLAAGSAMHGETLVAGGTQASSSSVTWNANGFVLSWPYSGPSGTYYVFE